MISIADYKKKFVDKQGRATAVLLNSHGESVNMGDATTVTATNGRLKCKWRVTDVPDQWHNYTHVALVGDGEIVYLQETTPIHFDGKPGNVEITFYD